jgi:Glu-tRNA(Gln) amidotransferase subunit E-like FAD-binding protein
VNITKHLNIKAINMRVVQIINDKEIDMTSLILKQMMGELTRDEVEQIINDNIIKNSDEYEK